MDESTFLIVERPGYTQHLVDPEHSWQTMCEREVSAFRQAQFLDGVDWRWRTLADVRRNHGHLFGVCKVCLRKAGVR